jgi:release factor glutamine methyltransferase
VLDDVLIATPPDPALRSIPPAGRAIRTWALPGVYGPAEDTRLLADALLREDLIGARVLDLCTGTGFLAATAARAGATDVTGVDVSRRAAMTARMNLWRNGGRGVVRRGDLLAAAPEGDFDVIVSNPPYVPAPTDVLPTRGPARAWDGGLDGRAVVDRICADAPGRLRPGGVLLLVHSHVAGVQRTLDALRAAGLDAEIGARRSLTFGPVMRRRRELLREARLIDDGDAAEVLVVVRALGPGARR